MLRCVLGCEGVRFKPDNGISSWIRARGNTVSAWYGYRFVLYCPRVATKEAEVLKPLDYFYASAFAPYLRNLWEFAALGNCVGS